MDKIIGLGQMGCNIAEEFSAYPEYRIYKIMDQSQDRGVLELGSYNSMEDYERNLDENEVTAYLRSIKSNDEVLVVLGGGEAISGAVLKILHCIKDSQLNVLYIAPDRSMSSLDDQRNDKISFNVLQEYARSGAINQIILIDYPSVEQLIGEVSIQNYNQQINYLVCYAVAMTNFFKHTDPVMNVRLKPTEWASLTTIGVGSLESAEVNYLFPLEKVTELHFYFGIPLSDLQEDNSLMKRIKDYIKEFKDQDITVSFSVHETTFGSLMVLCEVFSPHIQPFSS